MIAEPMPVPSVVRMTRPGVVLGGAEVHLGQSRGVGVVDEHHLTAELLLEVLVGLEAVPLLVEVGHERHLAVQHRGGDGEAHRVVADDAGELVDDLAHHRRDVLRRRLGRRRDAEAVAREVTDRQVHRRALDAGPADVDTQEDAAHGP